MASFLDTFAVINSLSQGVRVVIVHRACLIFEKIFEALYFPQTLHCAVEFGIEGDDTTMTVRYWLMKSEPSVFSIDDLAAAPQQTTSWEGVRNYQARNMLRDEFQQGDRVLYYHSACDIPAVVGTATVVREGYVDHFAHDRKHHYYDAKSFPEKPRWYMVDIQLEKKFARPVTLAELRDHQPLKEMDLLRKGNRLSVQRVTKKEFDEVVKLARRKSTAAEVAK